MVKESEKKEKFVLQTPGGYELSEVRSSVQKMLRQGKEEAYWAMEFIEGGFWRYLLKSLQCVAVEDIGLADPLAIVITTAVKESVEFKMEKKEKGSFPTEAIGFLILYLARAKQSREGDDFIEYIKAKRKAGWKIDVPKVALDMHCSRGRKRLKEVGINGNEEFYHRGSKLKNEVVIEGNKYRKRILEVYGLKEEL